MCVLSNQTKQLVWSLHQCFIFSPNVVISHNFLQTIQSIEDVSSLPLSSFLLRERWSMSNDSTCSRCIGRFPVVAMIVARWWNQWSSLIRRQVEDLLDFDQCDLLFERFFFPFFFFFSVRCYGTSTYCSISILELHLCVCFFVDLSRMSFKLDFNLEFRLKRKMKNLQQREWPVVRLYSSYYSLSLSLSIYSACFMLLELTRHA